MWVVDVATLVKPEIEDEPEQVEDDDGDEDWDADAGSKKKKKKAKKDAGPKSHVRFKWVFATTTRGVHGLTIPPPPPSHLSNPPGPQVPQGLVRPRAVQDL